MCYYYCGSWFLFLVLFFHVIIIELVNQAFIPRKEGNVWLNNALNTFSLRLYGIIHMVKDHSDSQRVSLLPPHGLLFPISSKGFIYMHHPTDRITHTMAFVTPVVEHWLERPIVRPIERSNDPSHHERTILPRSYISLLVYI